MRTTEGIMKDLVETELFATKNGLIRISDIIFKVFVNHNISTDERFVLNIIEENIKRGKIKKVKDGYMIVVNKEKQIEEDLYR
ncbi:MAG TPA: hypothetical protein DEV78_03635 [Clostridiales bacterium]|mgnify:CR=1 FL=1|nr:hypothetical protein [Clostridiales bacterium]